MPLIAAPNAAPVIASSEIGVSNTRSAPYFSNSPVVTAKTPPASATSSPKMITLGSAASSSSRASRSAVRNSTGSLIMPRWSRAEPRDHRAPARRYRPPTRIRIPGIQLFHDSGICRNGIAAMISVSSSAPRNAPTNDPRPPKMLAPPSATAAMAVQRVGRADGRIAVADRDRAREHDPGGRREQRAADEGEHVREVDARAHAVRARLVRADRAQLEPGARSPQRDLGDHHDRDRRDQRHRHPADIGVDRRGDVGAQLPARLRSQLQSDTLDDDVDRQRREHRREPPDAHEQPDDEPDGERRADHRGDPEHEVAGALARSSRRTTSPRR